MKSKKTQELIFSMIAYYAGDPKRIQHFLKVYEFSRMIGEEEGLNESVQHILETTAIVHDIGIKVAEEKYGRCDGKLQEKEGPLAAKEMLMKFGFEQEVIERVSFLVGHHHTYTDVDGMDYQILIEADFLVNLYEDDLEKEAIKAAYQNIFATKTGKRICHEMYQITEA